MTYDMQHIQQIPPQIKCPDPSLSTRLLPQVPTTQKFEVRCKKGGENLKWSLMIRGEKAHDFPQ